MSVHSSGRFRRFIDRQRSSVRTTRQEKFDIFFGVVAPVVCLRLDPLVFKTFFGGQGLLGDFQVQAYFISALQIVLLAIWLILGRYLRGQSMIFGGALVAGSLVSLAIGVLILPLTLIGALFVIGFAGFTPFVTALVFFRAGLRAFFAQRNSVFAGRYYIAALAGIVAIVIPWAVATQVSRVAAKSVATILSAEAGESQRQEASMKLRWLPVLPARERVALVRACWSNDMQLRLRARHYYQRITGKDPEDSSYIFMD